MIIFESILTTFKLSIAFRNLEAAGAIAQIGLSLIKIEPPSGNLACTNP